MTRRIWNVVLVLACLLGFQSARAEFRDIKVDLTNGNLLTEEEIASKNLTTFGVAVAADGSVSRVAADDASAAIFLTGKYHSNEHGWGNFSSTVSVDGPVKVTMGSCAWGGDVTVKNSDGETVATFNTNIGACFHGDKEKNVASAIYKGGAATLTIAGGSYTPYIAVEAVDPSTLVEDAEVSFGFGDYADCGLLPASFKVEIGKTFAVPANFTLYQEGKTLTGWTDGSKTYEIGEVVTVEGPLVLTPVFTDNTVTLADRTEAVTLRWDFQRQNGAPTVGFQGVTAIWVAQAKIGTELIDVKIDLDTRNGKIANGNWNDWAQMNGGTVITVPACQGAVVSLESYSATTTTTVDGQNMGDGTNNPSFTCAGNIEKAEIVIGDGSYFRYIQVVLPVVKGNGSGVSYTDEPALAVWAFNSANFETAALTPEDAFSFAAVNIGEAETTGTGTGQAVDENGNKVTFVKLKPAKDGSDVVEWSLKPVKGLIFTPTKVSGYIARFGTDAENGVNVSVKKAGGELISLGSFTAPRNNKSQTDDKYGSNTNYTNRFEIELTPEQQAELASGDGFSLIASIGVGNTKEGGFSDIRIEGTVSGTAEDVAKFTLNAVASPEEAGVVNIYPKADSYDEGSPIKISVEKNFGYKFINWTDASGKVVSEETSFTLEIAADTELTANFEKLATYTLNYSVEGGANLYMVTPTPAPTLVNGNKMYEEGTTVTLTAIDNPILTFTNWSDGQSSSEITFVMDEDKDFTAVYSAIDFVAGWDFERAGSNGRPADFASADNDAAALVMRNAAGETSGWLDKSNASGGYEGRPGAVNWRTTGLGDYYWQTKVNAEAFTDLKVITAMVYNYNAYQKYNVEYSLDAETWHTIGTIEMPGAKSWTDGEFELPAEANNQKSLFIRWIADKTSSVDGTKSDNDGACLGASYIVGTAKLIDDGTAPVLVSVVPEENSNTASINGKIVLTFDEKVKVAEGVTATLGDLTLTPNVTGKTVLFQYKNLSYGTKYTFSLPANSVMDLTDNAIKEAITVNFTTKTRPVVAKALFDAEVSTVDELVAALKSAASREDKSKRYRIFIHDGFYRLPASATATKAGNDGNSYPDPTTYVNVPNISFIGESMEGVVITNTVPNAEGDNGFGAANVLEGIGKGDVLRLEKNATGTYFQHLTMKSSMGDKRGRDIVLNDGSNKTVMKDVCLWAYQDTYVSNNDGGRFYFEGGVLRGRTDFLCGKGDVYYNAVTLQMCESGGYLAVPSVPRKYGYVFKDCEITGENDNIDGNYTLGRPWGSGTPIAVYIDTKMTVKPSAIGWNEMSGGWPKRFAEYNSMTSTGTVIDLSQRKTIFGDNHENNPVLTKEEADSYSYEAVMGGNDDWDPASLTEQAPAPANVSMDGNKIIWDDNDYVSCWAVCLNGKVIGFTITPEFDIPASRAADEDVYSVRAANEMGGLGEAVVADANQTAIGTVAADEVVSTVYYNLQGIRVGADAKGLLIRTDTLSSGRTVSRKVIVK